VSTAPVRVVLADDHEVVRQGLASILGMREGIAVVGEASDGEQAVDLCLSLVPDVLMLDLRMPGLDGLGVVQALKATGSPVRVLIVTTYDTDEDVSRTLGAGARGYLLKDAVAAEIVDALRTVATDELYLPGAVAARFVANASRPELTARETQILLHMAAGESNRQIGSALFIAETTVKSHLRAVFTKLGVSSRTEALAEAVRRGIIRQG